MSRHNITLSKLRPTQITVGMLQVKHKRKRLKQLSLRPGELVDFVLEHPVRVVLGPAGKVYVIDHHHLALALLKERYETAPLEVEEDFSSLATRKFWQEMERRKLVHPYGSDGKLRPLNHIPANLKELENDPYRSLAGFVREAGGFKKVQTPFAEFLWADFFRERIKEKLLSSDFAKAIKHAAMLASAKEAKHLPGYLA